MTAGTVTLEVENLCKSYGERPALRDISLRIPRGAFVVVLGPSGAGKSTLLRCINFLTIPSAGAVRVNGHSATSTSKELRLLRQSIGMIFQQFNLVPRLSVLSNVLTGRLAHVPVGPSLLHTFPERDVTIALDCLRLVGLADRAWDRTDRLSGGQQQRVGIARALAQQPMIVLADEPVGSLDPETARGVLRCLKHASGTLRIAVLCSLHQVDLAREFGERIVGLSGGRLVFDGPPEGLTPETLRTIYGRTGLDLGDAMRPPGPAPEDVATRVSGLFR